MPSRVENETEHVCMCVWGERRRETRVEEKERKRGKEREDERESGRDWRGREELAGKGRQTRAT